MFLLSPDLLLLLILINLNQNSKMQKKNNKMSQFFILPFFAFKTKSSVFH